MAHLPKHLRLATFPKPMHRALKYLPTRGTLTPLQILARLEAEGFKVAFCSTAVKDSVGEKY